MYTSTGRIAALALVLAAAGPVAHPAAAQSLPAASELIARYAREVGGEAWKGRKSARMKATMEVPAAGLTATIESRQIFPGQYMSRTSIGGMGEMLSGFDGTVAWQMDPMAGPRLLSGQEADQARQSADMGATLRQTPEITSSETVERTTMNNEECYKVKHSWKSGRESFDCFSVASGLIVATITKAAGPMGEMEVVSLMSEYQEFGGMKHATVVSSQLMGAAATLRVTSWEWDTVTPAEMELPAEIKALVAKKP
jgi:hypothetical protein